MSEYIKSRPVGTIFLATVCTLGAELEKESLDGLRIYISALRVTGGFPVNCFFLGK